MIKWIAFDLDNTLYPENQYVEGCYRKIVQDEFNGKVSVFNRMLEIRSVNGDSMVFQLMRDEFQKDPQFVQRCIKHYHQANIVLNLYDGVRATLEKLSKNYKLAMLTNGSKATQENKIRNLGIEYLFDKIIITGACMSREDWKPSPKAFQYMLYSLECAPNEVIFVGDSITKDIEGALKVGIQPVFLNRNTSIHVDKGEYWIVHKFEDILTILGDE